MMRERNRLLLNRLSILNRKLMMKTDRLWLYVILLSNYDHLFNDFKLRGSCQNGISQQQEKANYIMPLTGN